MPGPSVLVEASLKGMSEENKSKVEEVLQRLQRYGTSNSHGLQRFVVAISG